MKYIMVMLLMLVCSTASAGYRAKILYWYNQNVSTNVVPLSDIVKLQDDSDGHGMNLDWKIANPPSKAVIDAINEATAAAWLNARHATEEADYDKWSPKEKAMMKVIVTYINELRSNAGLPPKNKATVLADLKAELDG